MIESSLVLVCNFSHSCRNGCRKQQQFNYFSLFPCSLQLIVKYLQHTVCKCQSKPLLTLDPIFRYHGAFASNTVTGPSKVPRSVRQSNFCKWNWRTRRMFLCLMWRLGKRITPFPINDVHIHLNTCILSLKKNKRSSVSIPTSGCVQASPSALLPSGIVIKQQHSWVGMLI